MKNNYICYKGNIIGAETEIFFLKQLCRKKFSFGSVFDICKFAVEEKQGCTIFSRLSDRPSIGSFEILSIPVQEIEQLLN